MPKTLTRLADFLRAVRQQQITVSKLRNESYSLARADLATRALAALEESRSAPDPLAEGERRLLSLLGQDSGKAAVA